MTDLLTGNEPHEVIMGQKTLHKGALLRGLNSEVTIPCGMFGIRMKALNEKFIALEIICSGVDNPTKYHAKVRPKTVVVKEDKCKVKDDSQKELSEESLF